MSVKPRTVDNLGIEASIRYAKDKELFEAKFIEEANLVPQKTETAATLPYVPLEFDPLFSSARQAQWALFTPPPGYASYAAGLFSHQVIPSLGDYEKQEANTDKVNALEDAVRKHKQSQGKGAEDEESEEEETERQVVIALLECVTQLDKNLRLVNARRNQYQRG
jgi:hypothetical protein